MPRKRPRASVLREPLSYALGTLAKVGALRALAGSGESLTQRDVARRAGVQHRSIQLALDELVTLGVVARTKGGRDYLVRLNENHRLFPMLRALLAAEAEHFLELRTRLTETARGMARRTGLVNLVLFGSVARGEDRLESDCDVLLVTREKTGVGEALAELGAVADQLQRSHGCRIRPIAYAVRDATRRWRAREAPFADIRRDAVVLFGPPLAEGLGG